MSAILHERYPAKQVTGARLVSALHELTKLDEAKNISGGDIFNVRRRLVSKRQSGSEESERYKSN